PCVPNHLNPFPHPLPDGRLQTFSQRTLLDHFLANASLPHGVFLLCPKPPAKRFRAFLFKPSQENTPSDFLQESGRNPNEQRAVRDAGAAFRRRLRATEDQILRFRARGKSNQSIFCDTIEYLLSKGPLT